MADEENIGTHRVRVDGDTVLTRYIGVPEYEHVREIHRRFDEVLDRHGRLFIINDMRRTDMPSTRTRRWIAEWARVHPIAGIANFGASLPIRMVQSLLMRAAGLLGQQPVNEPVHCGSEAEAYAWVAARREALGPVSR